MGEDFIDTTARCYKGGVIFRMLVDNGFATVRVSDEVLADREGGAEARANLLNIFQDHRHTVEGVARRKIKLKILEKDGSVLVAGTDLQG